MDLNYFCRAALRALTTRPVGPTLYDLCDPLLLKSSGGNAHLQRFYKTALANAALRLVDPGTFEPALACIARNFGEGGQRAPFKAYEWNKMKTPTRILVGGPEVTSALVLSALVHARAASRACGSPARVAG